MGRAPSLAFDPLVEPSEPLRKVTTTQPGRYNSLVRVKITITLPEELLISIDQTGRNRSAFIERACRGYLARLEKMEREARDIHIINALADDLNEEAADVLEYQLGEYA